MSCSKTGTLWHPFVGDLFYQFVNIDSGGWKLEVGSWTLETGNWNLEAGSWKLEAHICRFFGFLL